MDIHIEDISLLPSFLFIKCCLYVLKIIVTHDMAKCLFYFIREWIYIFNYAFMVQQKNIWFVCDIVSPWNIFCCNWNYCNETFACGNIANYHKTIVCYNMALCNETIYVATTHIATKYFMRQLSLLPQNNLHGNWAYYHETWFVGIGLVATRVYVWQQHPLPQNN
jgi:hypothetical protein